MALLSSSDIDRLYQIELEKFRKRIPKSISMHSNGKNVMPNGVPMTWMVGYYDHPPIFMDKGEGAYLVDVDGNRYLDMNHADMSMTCGYGHSDIVAAVSNQVSNGSQFMLPHRLAIDVSSLLGERFGLPQWQYTLSASMSNKECISISKAHTERDYILVFDGSYHGHIADTLNAESVDGPQTVLKNNVSIPFNDLDLLEQMLKTKQFALVMLEPAMTNIGLVKPELEYLKGIRQLCSEYGTLLLVDETHTHVCAWGGLTREWKIDPDFVVMGKSIAGGIPMGVYGMTNEIASTLIKKTEYDRWPEDYIDGIPLGGTLFGYPLALSAAKTVLLNILTPDAHQYCADLGKYLADGLESIIVQQNLPWSVFRLYSRSGVCYGSQLPKNASEANKLGDFRLNRYHRIFMANRGIWEAILTAGPAASFAMSKEDIDLYLEVFDKLVKNITQ